ncbi:MAG: AarF/UbiB family protein, partial [Nanoarchaeota archaeon]
EYCQEFSKLQEQAKPFPDHEAKKILQQELKHTAQLITLKKMIASASIGQVYAADLKGEKVAIKIMRPGIEKTIQEDLDLLFYFVKLLALRFRPEVVDPMEIYEQFRLYTEHELDYILEARNIDTFYHNFLKTEIKIPHVYWHFTTRRVLTMEYISGKKLTSRNLRRQEKRIIAEKLANCMFKQIFMDGVFHADPHPGNVIVLPGNNIALIDFGIVGTINTKMKQELTRLFVSLVTKNLDGVVDAFVNLNLVEYTSNREELKTDIIRVLGKYYDRGLKDVNMSELIINSFNTAKKHGIKLPKDFTLLGKALITLEAVGKGLNPEFNIVVESEPFVKHILHEQYSPKTIATKALNAAPALMSYLAEMPQKTNYFLSEFHQLDEKITKMESDFATLETNIAGSTNTLIIGIVIGALLISFSLVLSINKIYALFILALALYLMIDLFFTFWRQRRRKQPKT